MAIKLKIARSLVFPVKGEITLEDGAVGAFDFRLRARRLDVGEIDERFKQQGMGKADFVRPLIEGWYDVLDDDGAPVPYTAEGLDELFRLPGLAVLAFDSYLASVAAREKN